MHPETLSEKGREIFPQLARFTGFYLAGGTALALQIGHRVSLDFDLFSPKEIPRALLPKVKKTFSGMSVNPSVNNSDELTVFANDIKVTFLYYPFPMLFKTRKYRNVSLLSVKEIAATKAYTIGRRGAFKDYVDLYFVLSGKFATLDGIMDMAKRKFGDEFNNRLFLEQLLYLDDVEDTDVILLNERISKRKIKMFFEKQITKMKL